jgi:protein-S-isoprenylcysteine O-methyltransferase Ste14
VAVTHDDAQRGPERSSPSLVARSLLGIAWFALWFFAAFPGLLLYLSGEGPIPPPGANRPIALALVAACLGVLAVVVAQFVRRGGGTPVPLDPPKKIVSEGLFARVRNPMYSAYVAIAFGEAILYRSWALVGYALAFALLLHGYVVRFEEPRLRARFGAAYERYCEGSGRWLPRR